MEGPSNDLTDGVRGVTATINSDCPWPETQAPVNTTTTALAEVSFQIMLNYTYSCDWIWRNRSR